MNIVLTGFMASGKSTVGKCLSERLGRKFVDTDEFILRDAKMSVSAIFERFGEGYFRELEKAAVKQVAKEDNLVIATGGGVVLDKGNIDALRENGIIINLEPDEAVLRQRLKNDTTRPLIKDSDFADIMDRFEKRKPFYDDCDFKVLVNGETDADFVCDKITEYLRGRL